MRIGTEVARAAVRACAWLGCAVLVVAGSAQAEEPVGESADALPGVLRLRLPTAPAMPLAIAGTTTYGWYEPLGANERGTHQLGGDLALAWTPLRALSVRGELGAKTAATDGDWSGYGEPRFAARVRAPVGDRLWLGGEVEVRLVGAEAPSIDWGATTPTFRALGAYRLGERTFLGANLGLRLDNSAAPFDDPAAVPPQDRLTLGLGSFNALEFGVGVRHALGRTELLAELTGDVLFGDGAPGFGRSPLSLAAGVRHALGRRWLLRGHLEVSPTARPEEPPAAFSPARPRLGVGLGLVVRLGALPPSDEPSEPVVEAEPTPEPEPAGEGGAAPAAPPVAPVVGRVVDEGGRPVPDVEVYLQGLGPEPLLQRSDANGEFRFEDAPLGAAWVTTKTAGYDDARVDVAEAREPVEVVIYPGVPAGQLRGSVHDLRGQPVSAKLSIRPGDHVIEAAADGSFTIDLKPGRYTVSITADGHPPQARTVVIEERGVVVLSIALE